MSMIQALKNKMLAASVALTEFKNNEKGVTAVEYAVVIAGVTIVVLAIFGEEGPVNNMLNSIFNSISSNVTEAVNSSTAGAGAGGDAGN